MQRASLAAVFRFLIVISFLAGTPIPARADGDLDANVEGTGPKYLLRYKFHNGDELRYRTQQTVTQRAVATEVQKVDASRADQTRVFTISSVNQSGAAKATMQFETVHMEVQTNDAPAIVFDSSMDADKVPKRFRVVAEKLKSVAPLFTVQPCGTPLSEDGTEQIPNTGQACFLIALPKNEISVGDSWSTKLEVDVRMAPGVMRKIRLFRSYKLKSVEDDVAEIEFFTSIRSPVKSAHVKALLLQATPRGEIRFDVARGVVLRKELRFDKFVLGAMGPNTMLSAKGKTVEQLLEDDTVAATEQQPVQRATRK